MVKGRELKLFRIKRYVDLQLISGENPKKAYDYAWLKRLFNIMAAWFPAI